MLHCNIIPIPLDSLTLHRVHRTTQAMRIERFAPSPTGLLHLGHAYSATLGWLGARLQGGQFLLRMEDLDRARCRPAFYEAIETDLSWLGLHWDGEVLCQSDRMPAYEAALDALDALGVLFPCVCTRKDLREAIRAPQEGDGMVDGPVYPGTCRDKHLDRDIAHALRLNMRAAIEHLGGAAAVATLSYATIDLDDSTSHVFLSPEDLITRVGDVVLRRKDGVPAYHLAVVVDDAHQGITHVTRGADLAEATAIHRLLQALLGLPTPTYHHHPLVRDEQGKRLAKRDDARAIRTLRDAGAQPSDIFTTLGISDLVAESAL